MDDGLLDRIRDLWTTMGGAGVGFVPDAVTAGIADASGICPPGWVGVVRIGDAALIVAPDQVRLARISAAVAGLAPEQAHDPTALLASTPVDQMLGPAELAYLDPARFRPVCGPPTIPIAPEAAAELEAACDPADLNEARPTEATTLFAIRDEVGVAVACGYRVWLDQLAHMIVLTHPAYRGRGLAAVVSSTATAHALASGLIPQWRTRVPTSLRVATRLGYETIGAQLSVRIPEPARLHPGVR